MNSVTTALGFREALFELAFGDDAINKIYTNKEVLAKLREFSDAALETEDTKSTLEAVKKLNLVTLPEVAMHLHYFAEEVLKQLPDSIGDLFGIGEDCLVLELYPFAELIFKYMCEAIDDKKEFNGVFVYDVMEELAGLWITTATKDPGTCEVPELDEFELDIARVVGQYTK